MALQKSSSSFSSSSSSSSSFRWRFDVFVSYTGKDSESNEFKNHLINYLHHKRLAIFEDKKSERGQSLPPLLVSAIEDSRTSIVVFSENYAKSEWCLNELVKIMECNEMKNQLVFPIFYKVEPSVVRKQRGKYHVAMADHEIKFKDQFDKVNNWRKALSTVANITGWEVQSNEAQFIEKIAEDISKQITNRVYLYEADHPVGFEPRVSELSSSLEVGKDGNDVHVVVVFGPQGIGKTTIAKAVYNKNAHQFEGSSFLANVSENSKQPLDHGIVQMQKTLLSEILRDQTHMDVGNSDKGITLIKNMIGSKNVLLVFDDVNSLDDLQSLARKSDWFGKGSRIIVTTRDQNLLKFSDFPSVSTCEVKRLDDDEALKLFCWNAFRNESVLDGFSQLAGRAVEYAEGFPLRLIELGSWLRKKNKELDIELEAYKRLFTEKDIAENISSLKENGHRHSRGFHNDEIISRDDHRESVVLSARELEITCGDHPEKWSWISVRNSKFPEVAKLLKVYYFDIRGKMDRKKLSPKTSYTVYFVFKFEGPRRGFSERAVKLYADGKRSEEHEAYLDLPSNKSQLFRNREDGWMEIKMGELFISDRDCGEIDCRITEHDMSIKKKGLIVGGIEFRPTSMEHNR